MGDYFIDNHNDLIKPASKEAERSRDGIGSAVGSFLGGEKIAVTTCTMSSLTNEKTRTDAYNEIAYTKSHSRAISSAAAVRGLPSAVKAVYENNATNGARCVTSIITP